MNIKILEIFLKNFKGILEKKINFEDVTLIFGDNATGKTSIVDAFHWCFFDKDSSESKNFNIKTLDKDNNPIHGLEHEVSCVLEIDGKPHIFKKVFKEKWTRKRGMKDEVFSGHTTDYFIDEVPKKKKEYEAYIGEILQEEQFKLLSNLLYFNKLHWTKQREYLSSLLPKKIEDSDVLSKDNSLQEIINNLEDKSIEDYIKILRSQKKKFQEELDKIPTRIDELRNNLPSLEDGIDFNNLEEEREKLQRNIKIFEEKEQQLLQGDDSSSLKSQIGELELNKVELEVQLKNNFSKEEFDLQGQISSNKSKFSNLKFKKESLLERLNMYKENISLQGELDALREEWKVENKKTFQEPSRDEFICPTCKQHLPLQDVDVRVDEMKRNFESEKNKKINKLKKEGVSLSEKIKESKEKIDSTKKEVKELEKEILDQEEILKELESKLNSLRENKQELDYTKNSKWVELNTQIESLKESLKQDDSKEKLQELRNKKDSCNQNLDKLKDILRNKDVIEKSKERELELNSQAKDLSNKIASIEGKLFSTERYNRVKAELLEEQINSMFKLSKFKLFDRQINGGIVECCEVTHNGVPYSDLNNAMRINIGLDIINTLSKHFGASCPIFIDNAEGVIKTIEVDSQIIKLVVKEGVNLEVEYKK